MIFTEDALAGKRILVTGASSGLGQDAAIRMSQAGATLILCGRDEARLDGTLARLAGTGHAVVAADFGKLDAAHDTLVACTKDAQPLAGVFHAAGIASLRIAKLYNERHVEDVLAAALMGALGIAKACGKRAVLADGGSLVFMSSVAGSRGRAGMGVYAASRAAVGGLARALAAEFAARAIRVNEIVAGAVETPMHEGIVKNLDDSGEAAYRDLHLLGFGRPEDVSNAALFLLSDASRWITGTSMAVDGGYMAS